MKHGIAGYRKIKFHVKRLSCLLVLMAWLGATIACSRGYVTSVDITATAQVTENTSPSLGIGGQSDVIPTNPVENTPQPIVATIQPQPTQTVQPIESAQPIDTTTPEVSLTPRPPILYYAQAGDTLPAVSDRFGVEASAITSTEPIPPTRLINPGQLLIIPDVLDNIGSANPILPDSEVVYSPSALDFDVDAFVQEAGGYLSTYTEYLSDGWHDGAFIVKKIALENSINPRLLLGMLEYRSHWVYGQPTNLAETDYPMGYVQLEKKGLHKQLGWAAQQILIGYYGWRMGTLTEITFEDGDTHIRIAPGLNAGTVALQYLYSRLYSQILWNGVLYGADNISDVMTAMFGSAWVRAQTFEPLLPVNLEQPDLILPFQPERTWSYTGGPHSAWMPEGSWAALDFSPPTMVTGCYTSDEWVTAMASGKVVRSGKGMVVLDLDGDGSEQTGWVLFYMHIATRDRAEIDTWVEQGEVIGHPSCEGGTATGTHVHIARKYNGEWVLADGPLPFNMEGWIAHNGEEAYLGTLVKDDKVVTACTCGNSATLIQHQE